MTEPLTDARAATLSAPAPVPTTVPPAAPRPFFRRLTQHLANRRTVVRLVVILAVLTAGGWLSISRLIGWYHLRAGQQALAADHTREAFVELQLALATWPDDRDLQWLTARAARRAGAFGVADRLLTECAAAPELTDQVVLERVLLRASQGDVDDVVPYCQALLEQEHPDAPLIVEALVQGYMLALRLPDASFFLEQWQKRAPDHAHASYLAGRLQVQAGNQHEALTLFRRVLELDPQRDDARLELASLHVELGQAEEALAHLEWLRRRLPEHALVQVRLARCLDLLGRQDEATQLLDAVLEKQPSLPAALVERGKLAFRAGQPELAARYLREAGRREPGSYEAQYHLMQCLRAQGKRAEADQALERMNQIEKDSARLREIASTPASLLARDGKLRAEVGGILLRLGAVEQGQRWLEAALALEPRNPAAHAELARHFQSLGQFGKAERHRQLAGSDAKAQP